MGSSPVGVQCTLDYYFPRVSLLCLPLQHSFTSSSHSHFGRPLFVFSFISPKITNEEIIKRMHSKRNILQRIKQRKFNLFGHICRMEDNRLVKEYSYCVHSTTYIYHRI